MKKMTITEAFQWVAPRFEGHPDVDHLAVELVDNEHKIVVHLNKQEVTPALGIGLRPEFSGYVVLRAPDGRPPSFHSKLEEAMKKIMENPD